MPGARLGPYVVRGEIGRGGMGAILRVSHVETGAEYALKVIRPDLAGAFESDDVARFRREWEMLAKVDAHPGIVRVFTAGEMNGVLYVVMELVEGESFQEMLERGRLDPTVAVPLVARLARAVAHLHRAGIVHRDLKPGNVLIEADGSPRLLDLGLAIEEGQRSRLTRSGEVVGTPSYMAPEQVDPEAIGEQAGPAADVWSLGVILYAALTGKRPFRGRDPLAIMAAVLYEEPTPPTDHLLSLPGELEAICLRTLAKAPARRYPSADAFANDLERWSRGAAVVAERPGRARRFVRRVLPARGPRRSAMIVSFAALTVAAVGGLGALVHDVVSRRSAAAERTRLDEIKRRRGSLDALVARAADGQLEALDLALAELEELRAFDEGGGGGDLARDLDGRRKLIEGLKRLAAGDDVAVRSLVLSEEPWRTNRAAVVRVLAAAGQDRGLTRIVEKSPDLLLDERVGRLLVVECLERLEPSAELTTAILGAIDSARATATDRTARDRYLELAVRASARRVETLLHGSSVGSTRTEDAAFVEACAALVARSGGRSRSDLFDADSRDLLADLGTSVIERVRLDALPVVGAAFVALPPDDPRTPVLHDGVWGVIEAIGLSPEGARDEWERVVDAGILLLSRGTWPLWPHDLHHYAARADEATARANLERRAKREEEAVAVDGGGAELGAVMAALLGLDLRAGADSEGLSGNLVGQWSRIETLLTRERDAGDVEPAVLAWLAFQMTFAGAAGHRTSRVEARADELAGLLDSFAAPDLGADLLDRLTRDALVRDRERHPAERHYLVPLYRFLWLSFVRARGPNLDVVVAEEVTPILLDALDVLKGRQLELPFAVGIVDAPAGQLPRACWDLAERLSRRAAGRAEPCPHEETITRLGRELERLRPEIAREPVALVESLHDLHHGRYEAGAAWLDRLPTSGEQDVLLWDTVLTSASILIANRRPDLAGEILEGTLQWSAGRPEWSASRLRARAAFWRALGDEARARADEVAVRRIRGG